MIGAADERAPCGARDFGPWGASPLPRSASVVPAAIRADLTVIRRQSIAVPHPSGDNIRSAVPISRPDGGPKPLFPIGT
jgi:hypothetical protein